MKKLFALLLCAMLICTSAVSVFAAATGKNAGTVAGTASEMKLDGAKEAAYDKGLKIDGSTNMDTKAKDAATATYYVTYTKDALWVYAEIKDATLKVVNADEKKPSYKADSIEFMLDPDNAGANEPDKTPYQMRIDSYNLISARKGQKGTSLYLRTSEGGTIDFFEAKSIKTADGFVAEFKVPVEGLAAGKKLGINLCYNDWDDTGATRKTITSTVGVGSWTAESYDYITLGDIAVETTEAPKTETPAAPATFDAAVVIAVVAAVTGAGVVVTKKRH